MLSEIPEVDVNIPDKEGNTPIIFAAQAGIFLFSLSDNNEIPLEIEGPKKYVKMTRKCHNHETQSS